MLTGSNLSTGQLARVAMARSLLRIPSADLFLWDEASAALDLASERTMLATLRRLAAEHGKAVLVIAHRQRVLEAADEIIFLQGGKVVETGSYEQLMTSSGAFATMVNSLEPPC